MVCQLRVMTWAGGTAGQGPPAGDVDTRLWRPSVVPELADASWGMLERQTTPPRVWPMISIGRIMIACMLGISNCQRNPPVNLLLLLVASLAASTVVLVLAVRRGAEARRIARLYHAQEAWAEGLDRERSRAA
jgi:hypothetical protein